CIDYSWRVQCNHKKWLWKIGWPKKFVLFVTCWRVQ
ncbi:hypothetical protein GBAR_LOCUS7098, partial [Geodia barretti]